jgi:prephenate dehydrogenase
MAGSEKRGVEEADPALFQDALCFLTPTARSDEGAVGLLTELWQALGARVRRIDPGEHDRLVAAASHLPHLVAAALVNVTSPDAMSCAGGGFRDTTRVASGDPRMWADVCLHNRDRILEALEAFEGQVQALREILARGEEAELLAWLGSAKAVRDERVNA